MAAQVTVDVRFYPPPADLRRFFTTFYYTSISVPPGQRVEDALQPEWANLRIFRGPGPETWHDGDVTRLRSSFSCTGPSSRCLRFSMGSASFWGIGLLPLGWAQFVGSPAGDHANLSVDGWSHPTFSPFIALAQALVEGPENEAAELDRIIAYFRSRLGDSPSDHRRIVAIHEALVDPAVSSVAQLVERIGVSQRTIERSCHQAFGFAPKLLLRRQRFMRSLSQFMLNPSLKWIGAMDCHYHDQAQFVREFHEFMGMSPREYAAMPHPVLERFMHERAKMAGAPVQTMDSPSGVMPGDHGSQQTAA